MSDDPTKLACLLYTDYCRAVGGKAFNGDPLPDWEEFSQDPKKNVQAKAWISVASTAVRHLSHKETR